MQSHTQDWYRNALEKFPFVQALGPLDGDISQSFYDALLEEEITLKAIAGIKKINGGQLSRDERAREEAAIEKATTAVSKQYRRASIRIHPDRFGDQYTTEFEELQQAYGVLRDSSHRREYLTGFWGICDLIYRKRQGGETISSVAEFCYVASRHRDWLMLNAEKFQPEMPTSRKPEAPQRPLQILGGISSHMPRQILVRSLHANIKKVVLEIPVLQPSHEFYACVREIRLVIVDGAEEKPLKTLRDKGLEKEKCKDELRVEVNLPDHGVFFVAWCATMSFDTEEGATSLVTPRSYETRIDCFLEEHIQLVNKKPIFLRQARQSAGNLRSTLSHSTQTSGFPIDELERRFWNLHRAVAKARNLELKLIEMHALLSEKHSNELIELSDVLDNAAKPKAALEQAMEGKRAKSELKTFKWFVAAKIESGEATKWIKTVTEAELEKLHGSSNRLFQFFVDGNRAMSVGVGADTLETAAQREDLFTPKQCEKLREIRDEVERAFLAESEAVLKQEEEAKRLAELRKQMEENAKKMPWGSVVRLFGLKTHSELNGEVGTYIGLTDQGRYRVELFSQNRVISLVGENVCLLHQYDEKIKQVSSDHNADMTDYVYHMPQQPQICATETAVDNSYLYANQKQPPEQLLPPPPPPPSEPECPLFPITSSASLESSVNHLTVLVPSERIGSFYGLRGSNVSHLKKVIGIAKVIVGKEAVNGMRVVQLVGDPSSIEKAEAFCVKELSFCSFPAASGKPSATEPIPPKTKPPHVTVDTTSLTAETESTKLVAFRRRHISHAVISHRLKKKEWINQRAVNQLTLHIQSNRKLEKFIGPQCKGLKSVVDATGLYMIIVYNNTGDDGTRGIQLTGPPSAVSKAADLCSSSTNSICPPQNELDLVRLSHLVRPHGEWVEENATPTVESIVLVPSQAVGWLIGKQGRTLSRIADSSVGVEIISVCKFSSDGLQEVQVVGSESGVQLAESECSRILHTMNLHELSTVSTPAHAAPVKRTDSVVKTMLIPREVCGEFIGKHGIHLHEMKRITGVDYINVDPKVVDGSRAVQIKGPETSIAKVVALVEEFLLCAANVETKHAVPKSPPPSVPNMIKANSPSRPNASASPEIPISNAISHCESSATKVMRNGFGSDSAAIATTGHATLASSQPAHLVTAVSPDGAAVCKQSDLLEFLKDQNACLKCSAENFQAWLQSEDINTLDELMEAMEDDDFVRTDMQSNGLKGYKRAVFWKAIASAGKSQRKHAQPESSENLECPISHLLMVNDPVVAADGVTYERAAIEAWFAQCQADSGVVRSPMSNEILPTLTLTPVNAVRVLAREYAERHRHS